jgi:hypothetical protein
MRSNIIIAAGLVLFGAIVFATWRPAPVNNGKQSVIERGVVTDMYQAGIRDLVLKINGRARAYYLDEGLAQGFNLSELKNKLLNKKVTIKYSKPLNFTTEHTTHYISQVQYEDEIILTDE